MSERTNYPAGVPAWVDVLGPDPERLIEFYGSIFGWEFAGPGPIPGDPTGEYHVARLRGRDVAGVGSLPPGETAATGWNTYVRVESADATAAAVEAAGGAVAAAPFDALPAGRIAVLTDPDGATFSVWQPHDRQGAELVNEPSAWSMSFLNSADPDASAGFYRDVFGWEREAFSFGEADVGLFRLPGFVGGEPQQPVPRDVVATMMPLGPDQPAESHWGVDFWIDDADAAAAAAPELGGRVLSPPADSPAFRNAVLADPDGSAFSVSQLRA